jgi:hypothetical protein
MHYNFNNCPRNEALEKTMHNCFVLLFVGRTGSSYIIDVFNQHPQVKFEGEVLETFKGKTDMSIRQTEWIKVLFGSENASQYKAVGFKTKYYDIPCKDAFCRSLQDFRPTILFSDRRNVLKQALSRLRIEKFAEIKRQEMGEEEWRRFSRSNDIWNLFEKIVGIGKIKVDLTELNSWVLFYEQETTRLKNFLKGLDLDVVHYDYEDIINDPQVFFEKMFRLLGVESIAYETRIFKHTPDNLSEAIENFEELKKNYAGKRLEPFIN